VPNLVHQLIDALLVDPLGLFQQLEVHARTLGQPDERLDILWQAEAAEAQSGVQVLRPDARVEADGPRNFFDVGAQLFAEIRDRVRIGDLQRELGIRCVLVQFGSVYRGHM
jgi:hypothetical protein